MCGETPARPGPVRGGLEHAPGALPGQPPAPGVQEHRRAGRRPAGRSGQRGPGPDQVGVERPHARTCRPGTIRSLPPLPASRSGGGHRPRSRGVRRRSRSSTSSPTASEIRAPVAVQQFQQGPVAQRARPRGVAPVPPGRARRWPRGDQPLHLRHRDRPRQPPRAGRRPDQAGRVGAGQPLGGGERVQAADRDHRPARRTGRERRVLVVPFPQPGQERRHVVGGDLTDHRPAAAGQRGLRSGAGRAGRPPACAGPARARP